MSALLGTLHSYSAFLHFEQPFYYCYLQKPFSGWLSSQSASTDAFLYMCILLELNLGVQNQCINPSSSWSKNVLGEPMRYCPLGMHNLIDPNLIIPITICNHSCTLSLYKEFSQSFNQRHWGFCKLPRGFERSLKVQVLSEKD